MKRSRSFWDTLIVIGLVLWLILAPFGISLYLTLNQWRQDQFLETLRTGEMKAVVAELRGGADPNAREDTEPSSRGGWAGLMMFVFRVNETDTTQARTALSCACENRHADEIVPMLLSRGANVKAAQECSRPALQVAVERGNVEAARLLLERGVDVNNTYNYYSPLQTAITADNPRMVRLLLDYKARVVGLSQSDPKSPNYAVIQQMLQDAGNPQDRRRPSLSQ